MPIKKEDTRKEVADIFCALVEEYEKFTLSELAQYAATTNISASGNFVNDEGRKLGYQLIIGEPDFFENESENEEDDDEDDEE